MATLADIQAKNDALIKAVADEDTVIDGAVTTINGFGTILQALKDQLAAAITSNNPAALQAVVDSLTGTITDISAKKDALANAIATVPK